MKNSQDFIRAFQIFKSGITDNWVTILIPTEEFNNEILQNKINFYLYFGYQVRNI